MSDNIMGEYVPSTNRVRAGYIRGVGGMTWYEGKADELGKRFDRWMFEIESDAYDKGYNDGLADGKEQ